MKSIFYFWIIEFIMQQNIEWDIFPLCLCLKCSLASPRSKNPIELLWSGPSFPLLQPTASSQFLVHRTFFPTPCLLIFYHWVFTYLSYQPRILFLLKFYFTQFPFLSLVLSLTVSYSKTWLKQNIKGILWSVLVVGNAPLLQACYDCHNLCDYLIGSCLSQ